MSQSVDLHAIATRRVVYRKAGMDDVVVRKDLTYRAADGRSQPMDIYYPGELPAPAVILVTGYRDAGVRRIFGRDAKEIGSNVSWARLIAASGMAAVTYVNTDPAQDAQAVLDHLRTQGETMGVAADRLGVWACSGSVPVALSLLIANGDLLRCAAFLYPCTLDAEGTTSVADMSRTFGFANPTAGRSARDLPADVPLFLARAGRDENPGLNVALDAFVAQALAVNLPVTVANHHSAPHAFDAVDDSDASRAVVQQILAFLAGRLL